MRTAARLELALDFCNSPPEAVQWTAAASPASPHPLLGYSSSPWFQNKNVVYENQSQYAQNQLLDYGPLAGSREKLGTPWCSAAASRDWGSLSRFKNHPSRVPGVIPAQKPRMSTNMITIPGCDSDGILTPKVPRGSRTQERDQPQIFVGSPLAAKSETSRSPADQHT